MPKPKKHKSTKKPAQSKKLFWAVMIVCAAVLLGLLFWVCRWRDQPPKPDTDISTFKAAPFSHARPLIRSTAKPGGYSPSDIRAAYGLTNSPAGRGTIAIITAFDDPNAESDLNVFSRTYHLTGCTTKNKCFEKHKMTSRIAVSSGWAVETALDTQWAHAIAPGARILLVEAKTNGGPDLLAAINYARSRRDVVSISMSWGGDEFATEANYESIFSSPSGAVFFAASGDSGHGVSWPAASAGVVGVGGTTLRLNRSDTVSSETAWSGSGGGVSAYIPQPNYQTGHGVQSGGKRAMPDASYNADPATGFPVYNTITYARSRGWFLVGGTSAGAPQWAAISTLAGSVNLENIYNDATTPNQQKLQDITLGTNGSCGSDCSAVPGFDFVTGVGSPRTWSF